MLDDKHKPEAWYQAAQEQFIQTKYEQAIATCERFLASKPSRNDEITIKFWNLYVAIQASKAEPRRFNDMIARVKEQFSDGIPPILVLNM